MCFSTVYCRTHNVSVCLYIAYIACGSASLYIKTLYFCLAILALSAAATVAKIKIRYDAKIPQYAIFGTLVIYVFYSICFVVVIDCIIIIFILCLVYHTILISDEFHFHIWCIIQFFLLSQTIFKMGHLLNSFNTHQWKVT